MGLFSRLLGRSTPAAKAVTIHRLPDSLPLVYKDASAVPIHQNSVVMSSIKFATRAFPEAPLVVERLNGDVWEMQRKHRLAELLAKPNPYYGGSLLLNGVLASLMVDGNAYILKLRSASRRVQELWYAPHYAVKPICNYGDSFVSHYEYTANGKTEPYAIDDVIHIRDGIDFDQPMLGLSALKSVAREVLTDNEIAVYSHSILKNMGVVGVIISPKNETNVIQEDEAKLIKEKYTALTTGNNRGEPLVLDAPLDVQSPGYSPKDLAIDILRHIPESRICAVLGIHPTVLGLAVGLEHSTFSNMKEAREMAYESFIIPMQTLVADAINSQLLPDLGQEDVERVRFDLSQVRVLQEDENSKAERLGKSFQYGGIKRSEYRSALGYDYAPEDEVYYTDIQLGTSPAQDQVVKSLRTRAKQRKQAYDRLGLDDSDLAPQDN